MLKQRLITALVLAAIILSSLFLLPFQGFAVLLFAVWFLAAWEWADLSSFKGVMRIVYATFSTVLLGLTVWICGLLTTVDQQALQHLMGLSAIWWCLAFVFVVYYPKSARLWSAPILRGLMGLLVLIPSAVALLYLLTLENGHWYFIYTAFIVVSADVGAYFSGRRWGKKKLLPAVSPGKSWAGFFGGVVACIVLVLITSSFTQIAGLQLWQLLMATFIAGLVSVLGDLLESMVKRHRGIKDSSQLLPGHGGFMDRIDSITAAAPVFVLMLLCFKAV